MTTTLQPARIGRREVQSPRASASVVTASLLILLLGWFGTEIMLAAFAQPPLLASPLQVGLWAAQLPAGTVPALLITAGLVLALLGLVLILAGLLPGNRARHRLCRERTMVIVDDGVIAGALSRVAHQHARLTPEQVGTTISRRRVDMTIRPTSGVRVDGNAVQDAVQAELSRYNLDPEPRLIVRVSDQGAVGI